MKQEKLAGLPWYQKQSLSLLNPEPMRYRSEKCCSLCSSDSLMRVRGLHGMSAPFSDGIHCLEDGHRSFLESKFIFVSPKLKK